MDVLRDPVVAAVVTVIGNFLLKIFSDWWDRRQERERATPPERARKPRRRGRAGPGDDRPEDHHAPWL